MTLGGKENLHFVFVSLRGGSSREVHSLLLRWATIWLWTSLFVTRRSSSFSCWTQNIPDSCVMRSDDANGIKQFVSSFRRELQKSQAFHDFCRDATSHGVGFVRDFRLSSSTSLVNDSKSRACQHVTTTEHAPTLTNPLTTYLSSKSWASHLVSPLCRPAHSFLIYLSNLGVVNYRFLIYWLTFQLRHRLVGWIKIASPQTSLSGATTFKMLFLHFLTAIA